MPALHLLLVDDHTVVREGLKHLLESHMPEWTIIEAGSGFEALDWLRLQPFDLVIMDLSMPGMSGMELIRRVKSEFPAVAVLVLTMHSEEQYAMRAFEAGARGYVTKDTIGSDLVAAIRKVASGRMFVSTELAEHVVQHLHGERRTPGLHLLSSRELDVFQRIVAGQRPVEIANAMHMSIKTVSTHKRHIMEKLQVRNVASLIRFALEHEVLKHDHVGEMPPR